MKHKFKIQPSKILLTMELYLHFLSQIIICILSPALTIRAGLGLLLFSHLLTILRRYLFFVSPRSIHEFWQHTDRSYVILNAQKGELVCTLQYPIFLCNCCILLNFKANDTKRIFHLPILRDTLHPLDFHRLKVLLRFPSTKHHQLN